MTEEEKRANKNLKHREYNAIHKEEISAKRRAKVTCECGMQVCQWNIASHLANGLRTKLLQKKATTAETQPTTNATTIDI